ncbi:hypothetical protein GCM10027591_02300 [Zhihengliuella somnathii]
MAAQHGAAASDAPHMARGSPATSLLWGTGGVAIGLAALYLGNRALPSWIGAPSRGCGSWPP